MGENCGIVELIDSCDFLPNTMNDDLPKYIGMVGCFLQKPSCDTTVYPDPNSTKLLKRTGEHMNSTFPETKSNQKDSKITIRQGGNQ